MWIKVVFMPVTGNATNDPKVGYEVSEGNAPEEMANWLELLVDEAVVEHTLPPN